MNSNYFSEEHELFRESFRDFLHKEVVPHIEKWEKTGTIDRFIWKKFGDMGFFGINYPEAYGGLNLDLFYTVILLEELQKINSGDSLIMVGDTKDELGGSEYSEYIHKFIGGKCPVVDFTESKKNMNSYMPT